MTRDEAITKLREHAAELQAGGIAHLALFGSTARNEAGPESDVDLMAEYDSSKGLSLLDICKLQNTIEDLLQAKVDLCSRNFMKPLIRVKAEEDAVDAF